MSDVFTCGACPCWEGGECHGGPARYGELCSAYEGGRRQAQRLACWGRILEVMREQERQPEAKPRQLAMWQEGAR